MVYSKRLQNYRGYKVSDVLIDDWWLTTLSDDFFEINLKASDIGISLTFNYLLTYY